jgi:beta-phosphoglucomutase-like phosphatase (HAD superfamily)
VVFEDAYHALLGAHTAGMAFAAVYDAGCREWALMEAEADWIVAGPA